MEKKGQTLGLIECIYSILYIYPMVFSVLSLSFSRVPTEILKTYSMLHSMYSMCATCVFRIYISTCNGIIMIIILLHSIVRWRICVTVSVYCCWSFLTCRTYQMFVYSMASTLIYMRWYVNAQLCVFRCVLVLSDICSYRLYFTCQAAFSNKSSAQKICKLPS